MNPRKRKKALALYGGHPHRSWYSVKALSVDEVEVLIYDEIGVWGISAKDFVAEIKGLDVSTIRLRINSPGGDVFDGIAILNALREHPAKVVVQVDALAASIASVIALAGDERIIASNAYFMVHNPWGLAIGDAAELRKFADLLERVGDTLVKEYASATGQSQRQIREWMNAETWFDADQSVEHGFATAKADATGAKAAFDLTVFNNAPKGLAATDADEPTEREIEAVLREAGLSRKKAEAAVAAARPVLQGEPAAPRGDPALVERFVTSAQATARLLTG